MENDKAIPDWIIKYDAAGHQSSAGKAIRFLMERIKQTEKYELLYREAAATGRTEIEKCDAALLKIRELTEGLRNTIDYARILQGVWSWKRNNTKRNDTEMQELDENILKAEQALNQ